MDKTDRETKESGWGNTGQSVHHAYNWLGDKSWQEVRSLVQVKSLYPFGCLQMPIWKLSEGLWCSSITLQMSFPSSDSAWAYSSFHCPQKPMNPMCPEHSKHHRTLPLQPSSPRTAHDLSAAESAILLSCHCYWHYNCSHPTQSTLLGRHNIIPVLQSITLGVS